MKEQASIVSNSFLQVLITPPKKNNGYVIMAAQSIHKFSDRATIGEHLNPNRVAVTPMNLAKIATTFMESQGNFLKLWDLQSKCSDFEPSFHGQLQGMTEWRTLVKTRSNRKADLERRAELQRGKKPKKYCG